MARCYTIWFTLSLMALVSTIRIDKELSTQNVLISKEKTSQVPILYYYNGDWDKTPSGFYPPDGSTWMSRLSDDRLLRHVYIPGTHDSGARHGGNLAKCQTLPIGQQLKAGVRFLDLRAGFTSPADQDMKVYHDIFPQYASFDDIWKDITSFLASYPQNFIIVRLRLEGLSPFSWYQPKIKKAFDQFYNTYSRFVYTGNDQCGSTRVRDLRGKIFFYQSNWLSERPWVTQWGSCFNMQDKYDANNDQEKTQQIQSFVGDQWKVNINFFSYQYQNIFHGPDENAQTINPLIDGPGYTAPQIMVFDFITGYIASNVYSMNYDFNIQCDEVRRYRPSWSRRWTFNKGGKDDQIVVTYSGDAQVTCVNSNRFTNRDDWGSLINTLYQSQTARNKHGCSCYLSQVTGQLDVAIATAQGAWANLVVYSTDFWRLSADGVGKGVTFRIINTSSGNWAKNLKIYSSAVSRDNRDWGGIGDDLTYVGNHGKSVDSLNFYR